MAKWIISAGKIFILLAVGFLIGKFVSVSNFEIDNKINLFDIVSILTTLFAVWWVSEVLDKKNQKDQGEKDLVIKRVDNVADIINEFQNKVSFRTLPLTEITSSLKRINVSINAVYLLLEDYSYGYEQTTKTYINLYLNNIKILLTDTPQVLQIGILEPELAIENGIVKISEGRHGLVQIEFENLKNYILLFEFEINRK